MTEETEGIIKPPTDVNTGWAGNQNRIQTVEETVEKIT